MKVPIQTSRKRIGALNVVSHWQTRSFTAATSKPAPMAPPPVPQKQKNTKRKTKPANSSSRKKRKVGENQPDEESDEAVSSQDEFEDDGDFQMMEGSDDADYESTESTGNKRRAVKTVQFTLVAEEEEEKPKPVLQLKYKGFSIYGQCLCIVVEPWPPIRVSSRATSILRATPAPAPRESSIAPLEFVSALEARARSKTPLFLPDIDEYERGTTPFTSRQSLPPITTDVDDDNDDDDNGGMMQFSQVLNRAGDNRAGAIDEDEDMEGAVLFGDADEYKEL
ncbi:hypothetical protein V5O48_013116 [Marasmius crinis-equi]|uniref:Uncharacterized protein n=1 Tax=Marasmius crinis-equi TaxID=585013 RepID=A0ABR3F0Z3_9AGAR